MKQTLKIAMVLAIAIMLGTTLVSATTSEQLPDELYEMAKDYGVTVADKVRFERYLTENPVTDEVADYIVEKAAEILGLAKSEGVTDFTKLSAESKQKAISIANQVASELGLTLKFSEKSVAIYQNGKLIEVVRSENGILVYTGNDSYAVLAVSAVAVIALATVIVAKRKIANA